MERLKSLFFSASEIVFPHNSPRPYLPVKMADSSNGADTVIGATLMCLFHRQIADFNDRCQNSIDIDAVSDHKATHKFYLSE